MKMFVFNTNSWHYKLVMYVFGNSLFVTKEIDDMATLKKYEFNVNKKTFDDEYFVYKYTPKVVNLCPYCRAVLYSVPLVPFAFIRKLLPKRKHKPFDIKKSRRNGKIIRIIAMIVIGAFGVHQFILGNYYLTIFHFTVASFQIWGGYLFRFIIKWQDKREERKKPKEETSTKQKNPSLLKLYLQTNHDKICPAIAFVNKNTEVGK